MQLFFGLMALAMVGVKYKSDKRDQYLQHGGWFVKVALWVLFNVLPFFFPVSFVNGYGAPFSLARKSCPSAHSRQPCYYVDGSGALFKNLHSLPWPAASL